MTIPNLAQLAKKSKLSRLTQEALNLPSTAQEHFNLYSMVNFAPIYEPIIKALKPSSIVEIGADQSENSLNILKLSETLNFKIKIVDTQPITSEELAAHNNVEFFQARSIDFLNKSSASEIYFVDGDHNYQTLNTELNLIATLNKETPNVMFLHDTCWPHAYRDMYYDVSTLDTPPLNEISETGGPILWQEELDPKGHHHNGGFPFSKKEGGAKNGLQPAVNDFLNENKEYSSLFIPAFYGLTILWKDNALNEETKSCISNLQKSLELFSPLLSTLEWNRLIFVHIQEMWGDIQAIDNTNSNFQTQNDNLKSTNANLNKNLQELQAKNKLLKKLIFELNKERVTTQLNTNQTDQHTRNIIEELRDNQRYLGLKTKPNMRKLRAAWRTLFRGTTRRYNSIIDKYSSLINK